MKKNIFRSVALIFALLTSIGVSADECVSEYPFQIFVTQSVKETYESFICLGETYVGHGFIVKSPKQDTICYREEDCNSYTLNLKVYKPVENNIFASICEGSVYTQYDFNESKGGVYTKNLVSSHGCDSTVILHLDVVSTATVTLFDDFCTNEEYNGRGFSKIKATKDTTLVSITMKEGCPATVNVYLTACYPAYTQLKDTVQRGTHYTKNGYDFNAYSDTVAVQNLKTVQGCDSTVTLELVVYHDYYFEESATICPDDSLLWHYKYYKEEGVYEARYKSKYDMDSIYVLTLKHYPVYLVDETYYLNQGSMYIWHKQKITEEGEYVDSMKTVHGCDSIIHLTVLLKYELVVPVYFTPDGDGINDTWVIANLECFPGSTVEIFDRYGRRLAIYSSDVNSWNGIYNGHPMPSDDYWYVIRRADTGQTYSGHFTLKRGKP